MNTPRLTVIIILNLLLHMCGNESLLLPQYIISKTYFEWLGREGSCGQKVSHAK